MVEPLTRNEFNLFKLSTWVVLEIPSSARCLALASKCVTSGQRLTSTGLIYNSLDLSRLRVWVPFDACALGFTDVRFGSILLQNSPIESVLAAA
jgi:hypothetical protein